MKLPDGLWWRLIPAALLVACKSLIPPAPPPPVPAAAPAAPPPPPGMSVEKVREELQVAPWEIALCGVRGETGASETVTARNVLAEPVTVNAIEVLGEAAPAFKIVGRPVLPTVIPAKGSLSVDVSLQPPGDFAPGLKRGIVRFQTGLSAEDGPAADLYALVTRGRKPDDEPPLQEIVESLSYGVDVGGRTLQLPKQADQIAVPFFQRANKAPVAINPVARFSADGRVPFGYFLPGNSLKNVDRRRLAVLPEGQHQTLNPPVEPGGFTSFDPGETRFGIWMGPDERVVYSESRRNRGKPRGLARIYPLKARGGAAVADAYLIAFGDEDRADYQDAVFVLWNVKLTQ
jgi:hypothetical protein